MDAWANVSHYLDYKSDIDIPSELRRDFYALSGLFYVADTHFEMFFKSRQKVVRRLEESEIQPTQEINFDSLDKYLIKRYPERERIDDEWFNSRSDDISELVDQLTLEGYSTIGKLENLLNSFEVAALAHEKTTQRQMYFTDVGIVRVTLELHDKTMKKQTKAE